MRVLWFTNTPSLFANLKNSYNGGGWISGLESVFRGTQEADLAISFLYEDKTPWKIDDDNIIYYPINSKSNLKSKIKRNLFSKKSESDNIIQYLKVIDDFQPDIIHIFGTESNFGLLNLYTEIPIVIHLQGLLTPYLNAYFPPGTSVFDYIRYYPVKETLLKFNLLRIFKGNASRELLILKNSKYLMGRTAWDNEVAKIYAPNAKYFKCNEVLREKFYYSAPWRKREGKRQIVLISTISKVEYKGFDLILKTAQLLKEKVNIDFNWLVFGVTNYPFWEKKLGIKAQNVNVIYKGVVSEDKLIQAMQDCDIFVHPSYIDNSPNSVCEAQVLGVPVITTNVGGVSSIVKDYQTGVLAPANDPYVLVAKIKELVSDPETRRLLGENAREVALKRHNRKEILKENLNIYQTIIKNESF